MPSTEGTLLDLREARIFESVAGFYPMRVGLFPGDESVQGYVISPEFDRVFGVALAAGRWFSKDDYQLRPAVVAVVSSRIARQLTHGREASSALGCVVWLRGAALQVVGVAQEGWNAPAFVGPQSPDVWVPLTIDNGQESRAGNYLSIVARLRGGQGISAAATASNEAIAGRTDLYPRRKAGMRLELLNYGSWLTREARPALSTLMLTSGLLLLLSVANLATVCMLYVLGAKHRWGIRLALGAGLWRMLWPDLRRVSGGVLVAACSAWPLSTLLLHSRLHHELARWLPFSAALPGWNSILVLGAWLLVAQAVAIEIYWAWVSSSTSVHHSRLCTRRRRGPLCPEGQSWRCGPHWLFRAPSVRPYWSWRHNSWTGSPQKLQRSGLPRSTTLEW